jgi:hypothetical protein
MDWQLKLQRMFPHRQVGCVFSLRSGFLFGIANGAQSQTAQNCLEFGST